LEIKNTNVKSFIQPLKVAVKLHHPVCVKWQTNKSGI